MTAVDILARLGRVSGAKEALYGKYAGRKGKKEDVQNEGDAHVSGVEGEWTALRSWVSFFYESRAAQSENRRKQKGRERAS